MVADRHSGPPDIQQKQLADFRQFAKQLKRRILGNLVAAVFAISGAMLNPAAVRAGSLDLINHTAADLIKQTAHCEKLTRFGKSMTPGIARKKHFQDHFQQRNHRFMLGNPVMPVKTDSAAGAVGFAQFAGDFMKYVLITKLLI